MADEKTASMLVLIGAILQLVFIIFSAYSVFTALPLLSIPIFGMMLFLTVAVIWVVFMIFGIIFMILWFMWRKSPSAHKTGLIVTGILGLILAAVLPGLLVLIGGIIAPGKSA
jgi:hypothetical protein